MSQQPFEAIVARYGPMVLRVCRAVLGPTAAEDAWSETFLAALRAYPDLRPDSNLEAWLVTTVGRVALNMLRARKTRREESFEERLPEPIVDRADAKRMSVIAEHATTPRTRSGASAASARAYAPPVE